MPELPEMQALAERLDRLFAGQTIAGVEAHQFSALKTVTPGPDDLVGAEIARVGRRGKFLVIDTSGPRVLVHLSQGGRVDVEDPPKRTRPRQAVVRLTTEEPRALLVKEFGSERKAGWWILEPADEGPMEPLGPEPDSDQFAEFVMSADDRRRLHTMLRDQRTVAGIGRGNTDDILHEARLSPFATLAGLDADERQRLLDAVRVVLEAALEGERQRKGELPTKLGDRFRIHRRHGEPCPRCDTELARVSYESYELVYCPPCQTGGKVLADRRMSRLLR